MPNPDDPDTRRRPARQLRGGAGRGPDLHPVAALEPDQQDAAGAHAGSAQRFSYGERISLVQNRIFVLEQRNGVRVVRGLTTDDGGFRQVTTRRIVDFAKAGIRRSATRSSGD